MNALRWSVTCGLIAAYVAAALAHDEPLVLLVGMFPVAWLAVELAWRALEGPAHAPQADTRVSPSLTGMRRGPNGLPNF